MKTMRIKLLHINTTIALFFIVQLTFGQANLQAYKTTYPDAKTVGLRSETRLKIDLVKGKPVIVATDIEESLLLDQSIVSFYTEDEIPLHSYEKLSNLKAYSISPTGKKIAATHFKTQDAESDDGIFHDDGKKMTFLYPGLEVGSIRFCSFDKQMDEFKFPEAHYFVSGNDVEKSVFSIDVDTSIQLLIYKRNFEGKNIVFDEKIVKGRKIMTWTYQNMPGLKFENNRGPIANFCPIIFAQIARYTYKGKVEKGVSNIADLFEWYYENVRDVLDEVPSDELKAKAEELTRDLPDELEKVKAVYYWVQEQVKYIAFEAGTEGVIPRFPTRVFEKRFGDCKDMASLIQKMLSSIGIKSYVTWIGTTDIPYLYTDFPSKGSDNHMIAIYEHNGTAYFLDATSEFQPIEYPTEFIQGKQGLACISATEYKVFDVPVMEPIKTIMYDTTNISIVAKKVVGNTHATMSGYNKITFAGYLKQSDEIKRKKLVENMFSRGNNSFRVINYSVENADERDGNLLLDFDFEVDNYITNYQQEIFVNLLLTKVYAVEMDLKLDRQSPFSIDFKSNDLYLTNLAIPEGYVVKLLPENVNYSSDVVSFSINYAQTETTVTSKIEFFFQKTLIENADFPAWKEFATLLQKNLNKSVVLHKL